MRANLKIEGWHLFGIISSRIFYVAPELTLGDVYDSSVDVFAFGILLYIVMTGVLNPYESKDVTSACHIGMLVATNPHFRPDLSVDDLNDMVWVKELCKKCWHHENWERPTFGTIGRILKVYSEENENRPFSDIEKTAETDTQEMDGESHFKVYDRNNSHPYHSSMTDRVAKMRQFHQNRESSVLLRHDEDKEAESMDTQLRQLYETHQIQSDLICRLLQELENMRNPNSVRTTKQRRI